MEGRRNFLKLMGASLALAGLTACTRQPTEHIMPYVRQPEELIPGKPLFYATAMTLGGVANGVLAESHEGRPTKIEGNPEHPATLGACDLFSQASVLGLYDPDRAQAAHFGRRNRSWGDAGERPAGCAQRAEEQERRGHPHPHRDGDLAHPGQPAPRHPEAVSGHPSGTSGSRPDRTARAPGPAWRSASRSTPTTTWPTPTSIVSLDSDFLASGRASLRYARQFSARRRVRGNQTAMNRLYVVEPMPTPTGAKADHRLPLRAADIEVFAGALATALGAAKGPTKATTTTSTSGSAPSRAT